MIFNILLYKKHSYDLTMTNLTSECFLTSLKAQSPNYQKGDILMFKLDNVMLQPLKSQQNNKYKISIPQQMQVFRKKFLYNSQKPVLVSQKVKTFQCMNTETKDQRYLLLQHLSLPPFVDPSPSVLQPIEAPTETQAFSVYPFVECCSNIKKLNEADAMYVLKCLSQAKIKKPMYYVLSPQGICVSQVEGLLPQRSPSLFEIAILILDIPQSLAQVQKSVVSKDGYDICKAIKDGDTPLSLFAKYAWKDNKKDKTSPIDNDFWIFKGRRKEEGPFSDQYGLAWSAEFNLCRFKFVDLGKDGYEEEFYNDYKRKIDVFKTAEKDKFDLLQVKKMQKDTKGIKVFSQIPNQGSLSDYINTKHMLGKTLNQKNILGLLQTFVFMMKRLKQQTQMKSFGTLHIKNIYIHNNKLVVGEPLLITDKVQKKIRQLKNGMDYFSPQLKQNILLAQNLLKLDAQKMDIWCFGFILHKMLVREVPVFDPTRKPILAKDKFTPGVHDLITRCLSLTPANRPSWTDINFRQLQKKVIVEQIVEQLPQYQQIKLGTRKQRISTGQKLSRYNKINDQHSSSNKKLIKEQIIEEQDQKLKAEQTLEQKQPQIIIPTSPKFKRFKQILKIVLVMTLYIFVFFRPFLAGSINLLLVRGYYTTASVHLTSKSGDVISTSTILTNTPQYFMLNDISFQKMYSELHCIDNNFNPIHDPNYQINSFIQSGSFLTMILLGWVGTLVICVTKIISLWRGGIGNDKSIKSKAKYWLTYAFHQLSLAALLFAHFYVFQFFYFSIAEPCLGIYNFSGTQPFFDSSLYLFLGNTQQYMKTVFACLGILGITILLSSCFYAWGPKLDTNNFLSPLSLVFRVLPYLLFILLCRVGVFMVLNPTAINDDNQILQSMISQSFVGLLGIVPEIFISFCVIFEVLYQILMNWTQNKIMESNKLSKFFNLVRRNRNGQNVSKLSKPSKLQSKLNDMSLDNSKHHLADDF